jgi:2',3'-cyclic-nucleotide 2'-phosphodiesterase (5'-nucleotidase family)
MKKYTNLIVIGIILLAAAGFFIYKNVNFDDLLMATAGVYDQKISIVNTADVHGHILYDDEVGGYYSLEDVSLIMGLPLAKSFTDETKRLNKNTLVLDCGDMFHGTNEANVDQGKGVVEVVNLFGYNAMVPGNHDFNFGFQRLLEIQSQLSFPIISANIYQNGKLVFDEYQIYNMDGVKIGVFGLTTPTALMYNTALEGNNGVTIEDPVQAAARVVAKLRPQVDAIVLISHLGDDVDTKVAQKMMTISFAQLTKQVKGIDLILAGHYHHLYRSAIKIKGTNTYLAEAGAWTTHVGIADLYFKNHKVAKMNWRVETTGDKSRMDKTMDAIAQKYYRVAFEQGKKVIGTATVKLNGIRSLLRSQETNLGDMVADAMKEAGKADLTLMNGGGIRESIPQGEVSLYKIGKVLPFSNSLVTIELKGDTIYKAVERGLRVYPSDANGPFLQVSGIQYVFDASKNAGERLLSITMDGKPLDRNTYYKVATNDYMYNGGDDYKELKDAKVLSRGGLLKDVLAEYIKSKGEVAPAEEGRIKVINQRYK